LRGFVYLKELNPSEPFFRQALGCVLFRQQKCLAALQEFLYGLSLVPRDRELVDLTLRFVCGLALYPAAVKIARHYERIGGDTKDFLPRGYVVLARAVTAALATSIVECREEDLSEEATEPIEELDLPARPWLATPAESASPEDALGTARIFISYRHSGAMNFAERLERALKGSYPSMHVFRDETWIRAGHDYVDRLREEIDTADIFIALIDRNWAQRFRDTDDVLGREVARALEQDRKIIPVLLEDAQMPEEGYLPDALKQLRRLHALRLTWSGLAEGISLLQVEMAHLFEDLQRDRRFAMAQLEKLAGLKERDPAAAAPHIARLVDLVPKYVPGKSEHGEGVPMENVELAGAWECTATVLNARLKLSFTLQEQDQRPFSGEYCITPVGLLSFWKIKREGIEGRWMPVEDVEKKLLLGLVLDGLKSGKPFKWVIPIHRRLGVGFVGTDQQGIVHRSRNVRPQPRGL
jgi:hypothetical protein